MPGSQPVLSVLALIFIFFLVDPFAAIGSFLAIAAGGDAIRNRAMDRAAAPIFSGLRGETSTISMRSRWSLASKGQFKCADKGVNKASADIDRGSPRLNRSR
jgi:hypothetical protein